MNKEKEKKQLPKFLYGMKIKTAIYAFFLFMLLSTQTAFNILDMIFNNYIKLLNDKNEPTILSRIIMSFILAFLLFIF
jgi:hypothetical protein